MKKVRLLGVIAGLGIILASCGSSNDVVSNRLISKRKYTKGFHINSKGHYKSGKSDYNATEDLANADAPSKEELFVRKDFKTRSLATVDGKSISEIEMSSRTNHTSQSTIIGEKKAKDVKKSVQLASVSKPEKIGHYTKDELKSALKKSMNQPAPMDDTAMLIILVILAILIPPLAVFIYEGATSRFWIDLILAIIGYGVGFLFFPHLAFLCGLAAVIYALLIVLEVI